MKPARLFLLTLLAMIAFAGNSILCRLALKQTGIDPASFTTIRILSGAGALFLIAFIRKAKWRETGSWPSALALFVYAAAFSFAYIALSAGMGALLLFGAVQATMILWGLRKGERVQFVQVIGLTLAFGGLILLVFPGLASPPLMRSLLMLSAGVAWGIYSLRGKTTGDPLGATAGNFIRAVPLAGVLTLAFLARSHVDWPGFLYAMLSGAMASGVGYAIWYTALPELKATSAATIQLSVPVIAAAGGIVFLGEAPTLRFVCASVLVLGGIALVTLGPLRRKKIREAVIRSP